VKFDWFWLIFFVFFILGPVLRRMANQSRQARPPGPSADDLGEAAYGPRPIPERPGGWPGRAEGRPMGRPVRPAPRRAPAQEREEPADRRPEPEVERPAFARTAADLSYTEPGLEVELLEDNPPATMGPSFDVDAIEREVEDIAEAEQRVGGFTPGVSGFQPRLAKRDEARPGAAPESKAAPDVLDLFRDSRTAQVAVVAAEVLGRRRRGRLRLPWQGR
jgi:hypothetical protein